MNTVEPSPPGLLHMTRMAKSFDGQRVLHDVDFDLRAGEVHVLAGENGAGKSTLIKILGGVHRPDHGEIRIHGPPVRFRSPREATAGGVAIIYQELSLAGAMSVSDNIFLGRERSAGGWMRFDEQRSETTRVLGRLGLRLDARTLVDSLPISIQQMIEIGKALSRNADIIVMDEPTSALNEPEVERLFGTIAELKSRGCGIIYITHKLEEVYRIADRITVLRDGRWVATAPARDMPASRLIRHMVGRDLPEQPSSGGAAAPVKSDVRLALEDVTVRSAEKDKKPPVAGMSFDVQAGEILGLAGLQGSGNSDLLLGLFGAHGRRVTGTMRIDGLPYRPTSPRGAIRRGIALVTNDRKRTGLVLGMGVTANTSLASLPRVSPFGWLLRSTETRLARRTLETLHLRAASLSQDVATLSGGNQQKVVLAKWLSTRPRVLLLDEPTRGVDVGAKQEIYQLMEEWRSAGHAMVLITSEMPELLRLSDRIIVMHRGLTAAVFKRGEATQERILHAAMGGD